jgi:hypothetical protein
MRQVEAILLDDANTHTNDNDAYRKQVKKITKHTIELDLEQLERDGLWGVARLEIAGKTYQIFPVASS